MAEGLRAGGGGARAPGGPAGEEVERDLGLPDRPLDDRPAVVGEGVGGRGRAHLLLPRKAAATPTASAPAATAAAPQIVARSLGGTNGCGGSPETSGSFSR